MQHSLSLKTLCLTFALAVVTFNSLQGVGLEDIFAMQPVELEEYLKERPTKEIQELKNLIALERANEQAHIEKYKERFEAAQYRIRCGQVVDGLALIALISSFVYMIRDVNDLVPKELGSVPYNTAQNLLNKIYVHVLLNYPSGIALLSAYGVSFISSIYTGVNAYLAQKNQTKKVGSLERLVKFIKLEEVVNQALM